MSQHGKLNTIRTNFQYFTVTLFESKPKTMVLALISRHNDTLGFIKWYGPWRQYCFFPSIETLFSKGCLADVETVLEEVNKHHKHKKLLEASP